MRRTISSIASCCLIITNMLCIAYGQTADTRTPEEIIANPNQPTVAGIPIPIRDDNPDFKFLEKGEPIDDINVLIGQTLPTLSGTTLTGENLSIEYDDSHKMTLIVFWASDCSACRAQMRYLNAIEDVYSKRGFRLVGVNMDERKRRARKVVDEYSIKWPSLFDGGDGPINKQFQVMSFPSMLLVDRSGKVIAGTTELRSYGLQIDGEDLSKSFMTPDGLRCALLRLFPDKELTQ